MSHQVIRSIKPEILQLLLSIIISSRYMKQMLQRENYPGLSILYLQKTGFTIINKDYLIHSFSHKRLYVEEIAVSSLKIKYS